MKLVKKSNKVPDNSLVIKETAEFDYCDSFQIIGNVSDSIDKITSRIFTVPNWVDYMMRFRNLIMNFFGLRGGDKRNANIVDYYPIGSKAIYFTVINRNENEIILAENDKHLNFKVSILIDRNEINSAVLLTTIVKYNNNWGWLYFQFIAIFHKFIIRALLRKAIK